MESIYKIAEYFLSKDSMSHKKLQKLCYYAQAWYLANYGRPLTANRFEAWVHGPVSPDLYSEYRDWGWVAIPKQKNEPQLKDDTVKELLDKVFETYGSYDGDMLEKITHAEEPWREARKGCTSDAYSRNPISFESMKKYYGQRIGRKW